MVRDVVLPARLVELEKEPLLDSAPPWNDDDDAVLGRFK
jgi:hypothetical protein